MVILINVVPTFKRGKYHERKKNGRITKASPPIFTSFLGYAKFDGAFFDARIVPKIQLKFAFVFLPQILIVSPQGHCHLNNDRPRHLTVALPTRAAAGAQGGAATAAAEAAAATLLWKKVSFFEVRSYSVPPTVVYNCRTAEELFSSRHGVQELF